MILSVFTHPLRYITLIVLVCLSLASMAKKAKDPDSLRQRILVLDEDTNKVNALYELAWAERKVNTIESLEHIQEALALATKLDDQVKIGMCLNVEGILHGYLGANEEAIISYQKAIALNEDTKEYVTLGYSYSNLASTYTRLSRYSLAIEYNNKSMELKQSLNDTNGVSVCLANIGIVFYHQSDFPKALEYFLKALKMRDEKKDPEGVAYLLTNIGVIYSQINEPEIAMEYFERCLAVRKTQNDQRGLADVYIAMASVGNITQEFTMALDYYAKAMDISTRLGYKAGLAYCYNNLGDLYQQMGDFEKSKMYFEMNVEIREELGGDKPIAIAYINMAAVNYELRELAIALTNIRYALDLSLKSNYLHGVKSSYSTMSDIYEALNKYEEALVYYKLKVEINDSIFNGDKSKEIGKLEAKYEFERQEEERQRVEFAAERKLNREESRRNNLQYSGILIFIVLIFAAVFMLGKIAVPVRLAEGMIFFSFLLFFEFALVLLDPYIEAYSGGAPAMKLGFNAVLAAAIFPLHSVFESLVKRRLIR